MALLERTHIFDNVEESRLSSQLSPVAPVASTRRVRAVDLFCGIGGLTHGLHMAGVEVGAGYDVDPSCGYAYTANNGDAAFIAADIRNIAYKDLRPHFADADVTALVGCAPCQPFSAHTRRIRNTGTDCSLLLEFARLVAEGQPDIVSIENVPGLAKHEAFATFLNTLRSLDYRVVHGVLRCEDYGVPQTRRRLVLLGSRLGDIDLPAPNEGNPTVADFIRDQPAIRAGEAHPNDPAHATMPLSALNQRRIRQSKQGGSWKDWDDDLVNACHTSTYYPGPYGRMRWNGPAPTITTQFCYYSTGRFGHPQQHRAISLREGALLQTFPADYALVNDADPMVIHKVARHVGNAVPVKLAQAIGQAILGAENVR